MVRFFNKKLKSHYYEGKEKILDLMDFMKLHELSQLLMLHVRYFNSWSSEDVLHLLQKLKIQLGIERPTDFWPVLHKQKTMLKDLFLTLELILESFSTTRRHTNYSYYFYDFVNDVNEFFLINKIPLQIRTFQNKEEFYIEKIISEEVSQKIGETLRNISEHEKTFNDFKNSIKEFSSGNYPESIKLCCKSLEDYFCLILGKNSCQSVETYYKEVSKKLKISDDLDNRFNNLVSYIHKYRSIDSHGRLENVEIPDLDLVNETIIQFTMSILNYLKKKK